MLVDFSPSGESKAQPDPTEGETRIRGVESAVRLQGWSVREDDPNRAALLLLFAFGTAYALRRAGERTTASRRALAREALTALSAARLSLADDAAALGRAFARNDPAEISALFFQSTRAIEDALTAAYAPADRALMTSFRWAATPEGMNSLRASFAGTRVGGVLDLAHLRIQGWARSRAVDVSRLVARESRRALDALAERARREKWTAAQIEQRIAMHGGLTRQQSASLERQRAALLKEKMPPSRVDRRLASRANRMRRERAMRIAEHEAHHAAHMGQSLLWREAADAGLIDGTALVEVWVTSPSERTCDICRSLDGKAVSIGGVYRTDAGGRALSGYVPPIHPRCRCVKVLMLRSAL
jgi:Phage Mu protein F like protein